MRLLTTLRRKPRAGMHGTVHFTLVSVRPFTFSNPSRNYPLLRLIHAEERICICLYTPAQRTLRLAIGSVCPVFRLCACTPLLSVHHIRLLRTERLLCLRHDTSRTEVRSHISAPFDAIPNYRLQSSFRPPDGHRGKYYRIGVLSEPDPNTPVNE